MRLLRCKQWGLERYVCSVAGEGAKAFSAMISSYVNEQRKIDKRSRGAVWKSSSLKEEGLVVS